ncbi:uncharacterized protein LOC117780250 [Drosophila innubila]|uniref:uncharacterized protein LOC117780250 n=1 Tax=Drosophila innubila TaxID=198719 RepID=UPI00148D7AE2|nr:uncharacterized protein LOC117780250 [Drosophila innubila]
MRYLGLVYFLLLSMEAWSLGNTACCTFTYVRFGVPPKEVACKNYLDSTRFFWTDSCYNFFCGNLTTPTPCCGVGNCNIFCCNCDGGCIPGNVQENLLDRFGSNITMIAGGPEPGQNKTTTIAPNSTTISPVA